MTQHRSTELGAVAPARGAAVDPEFAALCPPLTDEERAGLEANLRRDGCRDALVVWDGRLLDGHHRLAICTAHGLAYRTVEVSLPDRAAAIEWVIRNQLGRRNLPRYVLCELALRLEPLIAARAKAKQQAGGGAVPKKSAEPAVETREEVARAAGVSHDTLRKVREIVQGASESVKGELRRGETTINREHRAITHGERRAGLAVPPAGLRRCKIVAGPFALPPSHRQIWRAAAKENSRLALRSVALLVGVPALVACDGHVLAIRPIRPVLPDGKPGPYGTGLGGGESAPVLLPVEVFQAMPSKLARGQRYLELTVMEAAGGKRYVSVRPSPRGAPTYHRIGPELIRGQYPDVRSYLANLAGEPATVARFDAGQLAALAVAIGAADGAHLLVPLAGGPALVQRSEVLRRRTGRWVPAAEPEGGEATGFIMPMAPEDAPPTDTTAGPEGA